MRVREIAGRLSMLILTVWFLGIIFSPPEIKAQEVRMLSQGEAFTYATNHVLREKENISEWEGATLSVPKVHYDLNGAVSAYVFSVLKDGKDVGYINISSQSLANPVLEFSTAPAKHKGAKAEIRSAVESIGLTIDEQRPLYLGMLAYYYQVNSDGPIQLIEMSSQSLVTLGNSTTTYFQREQENLPGLSAPELDLPLSIPAPTNVVQQTSIIKLLYGPDYGWYLGCSPTAVANVMGHWADRGYPNLVYGGSSGDYAGTIERLAVLMGTSPDGWTSLPINDDISDFAAQRGYTFYSREIEDPTFQEYIAEIDAHRPVVILVNDHYVYSDHFITGFGYEYDPNDQNYRYMIVHDTWGSNNKFHWVQFGIGYSNIWYDTVIPPAIWLDTTPPVSQVNPLKSYQISEIFKLNWSGSDEGWGLMWYDIQYKDGLDGVWTDWITHTTSTQANFIGTRGATYYFRSRAADIDNNQELYAEGEGDTHTTVATYVVSGYVRGNRDFPVMGAEVTASKKSLGSTLTDGNGLYQVGMTAAAIASFTVEGNADFGSLAPMEAIDISGDVENLNFILPPAVELLVNGGFESSFEGWSISGNVTPTITDTAHTGANAVLLGQIPPSSGVSSIISQTISISAALDQPTLSFMAKPWVLDHTSDQFIVTLAAPTTIVTHTISLASAEWQHIWYDLREFSGQAVQVRFQVHPEPIYDPLTVFVDEISIGPASKRPGWIFLPAILKTYRNE